MYWTNTGGATGSVIFITNVPSPQCNVCGAHPTMRSHPDNKLWCAVHFEIENRRVAILQASKWLEAAFVATSKDRRKKLFRALSSVFHPDAGGDQALMIALNAVHERFP